MGPASDPAPALRRVLRLVFCWRYLETLLEQGAPPFPLGTEAVNYVQVMKKRSGAMKAETAPSYPSPALCPTQEVPTLVRGTHGCREAHKAQSARFCTVNSAIPEQGESSLTLGLEGKGRPTREPREPACVSGQQADTLSSPQIKGHFPALLQATASFS